MGYRLSGKTGSLWKCLVGLLALAFVAAGCGPLGDDEDEDPTATAESESTIEAPVSESSPESSPSVSDDTSQTDDGTPVSDRANDDSTPVSPRQNLPRPDAASTPVDDDEDDDSDDPATPDAATPSEGTTDDGGDATPSDAVSDGTSGATPDEEDVSEDDAADQESADSTPGAEEEATEPAEPVVADSCEFDEPPDFTGDTDTYVVVEIVNFRTGPGADCDPISDTALDVDTELTVLSDPVVREDDDGITWVYVDVDGEEGWVADEFIEPQE